MRYLCSLLLWASVAVSAEAWERGRRGERKDCVGGRERGGGVGGVQESHILAIWEWASRSSA